MKFEYAILVYIKITLPKYRLLIENERDTTIKWVLLFNVTFLFERQKTIKTIFTITEINWARFI